MAEPQEEEGMYIFAVQIPTGAEHTWNALTRAHGATATYSRANHSINFFPSQDYATKFTELSNERMKVPKIRSQAKKTRRRYDETIEKIESHSDKPSRER